MYCDECGGPVDEVNKDGLCSICEQWDEYQADLAKDMQEKSDGGGVCSPGVTINLDGVETDEDFHKLATLAVAELNAQMQEFTELRPSLSDFPPPTEIKLNQE